MNETPNQPSPSQKLFRGLMLVAFVGLVIVMLYFVVLTTNRRSASQAELNQLRTRSDELNRIADAEDKYFGLFSENELLLSSALSNARTAKDIPDFDDKKIVCGGRRNRTAFWVPEGNHAITITGYWRLADAVAKQTARGQGRSVHQHEGRLVPEFFEGGKSKQWAVRLHAKTGYLFQLQRKRMAWSLTSKDPSFTKQSGKFRAEVAEIEPGYIPCLRSRPILPGEIIETSGRAFSTGRWLLEDGFLFQKDGETWQFFVLVTISSGSSGCFSRPTAIRMMWFVKGQFIKQPTTDGEYLMDPKMAGEYYQLHSSGQFAPTVPDRYHSWREEKFAPKNPKFYFK